MTRWSPQPAPGAWIRRSSTLIGRCRSSSRGTLRSRRLDVREGLDGIERGTGELERLAAGGVDVRNPPGALIVAHDKLLTARTLRLAGLPHPHTTLISPALPAAVPELPSCSSRASAAGGATSSSARPPRSSRRRSSGYRRSRGSGSTARSLRSSSSLRVGTSGSSSPAGVSSGPRPRRPERRMADERRARRRGGARRRAAIAHALALAAARAARPISSASTCSRRGTASWCSS